MKVKYYVVILLVCLLQGCSSVGNDNREMDRFVTGLMERMTVREKLGQLNLPSGGDLVTGTVMNGELSEMIRKQEITGFFNVKGIQKIREMQRIAVEETRLKIPLIVGADVIHGYETIFPIPLAMSCSWDTVAVRRMARVAATEASADGICWNFSPMVDICRDARWGRIAEGNGEDPYLGALMTKAYVHGYQGDAMKANNEILACVKHFALYGASEAGRDYNTVDMSRLTMYNYYLAPYKAAVEAGVGSVMSSFNLVDGIPATANKWLLTDLLRKEWGFGGMVVTDYYSIGEMKTYGVADKKEASVLALKAGTDMDMVTAGFLDTLESALEEGLITEADIDRACRRVLETKYKMGLFDDPYKYCDTTRATKEIFTPEHRKEAREVASETFVLMKNEGGLLPLSLDSKKIALIGPMADARNNMCGMWSLTCTPSNHRSLLDGMRDAMEGRGELLHAKGSNIYYDKATEKGAARADVIVAALGECADMSGESASRTELELPDAQQALLKELVKTGKPVVLLLFTGRPLVLNWETAHVPAILNVWFAGSEAGDAIADALFGKVVPAGKLTTSFPRAVGQMPLYYNHLSASRPDPQDGVFNRYQSNYIDQSNEPLYPFGFGLSYTTFEYGDMRISSECLPKNGELTVAVEVTNSGAYDGTEIVQLYLHDVMAEVARPVKELKAFRRIFLKKGEKQEVVFTLTEEDLKYYHSDLQYGYDPGEFQVMVGPNSRDVQMGTFKAE